MSKPQTFPPTEGGSYTQTGDGDLEQVEASTEPNPGKAELARRSKQPKAAKVTSESAATTATKTEGRKHG